MMGFYPVTPGLPVYDLGSPIFDQVTIHLPSGNALKIVARNNSVDNKYIQDVKLNGESIDRVWFRHDEIVNGATLVLQMGNTPGAVGADPVRVLPELTDGE
jgi:putative alpha-1,2-mannosidase